VRPEDVRRALQSLRLRCSPHDVAASRRPLGIGYSFRVPGPSKYRPHWFCDPALPLAISSAVRFSFAGLRRSRLSERYTLSSSFAFLQSIAQRNLARQPQPADSSHGLLLPSALEGSAIHFTRAKACPLRSAFRVWLPSGRLAPAKPVPVLFHTGSALGIRPSELSPPARYPARFRQEGPTYRSARQFSRRRWRWAGPTSRGSWALPLARIPCGRAGFNSPATGCSLGLHPRRVY
jgi:hypothetical protein